MKSEETTIHEAILEKARPFLMTRFNDIHVALSYQFAEKLLKYHPEADEDVVLPAILLHDVGWKMVPPEKQLDAFGPEVRDNELRHFHETEGARIAQEILQSLGYREDKTDEIAIIITGHDTRPEGLSINDKLVKDADKLWRFTPTGVDIDHVRFGIDREPYMRFLEDSIEDWFFTAEAKKMAREALAAARSEFPAKNP